MTKRATLYEATHRCIRNSKKHKRLTKILHSYFNVVFVFKTATTHIGSGASKNYTHFLFQSQ